MKRLSLVLALLISGIFAAGSALAAGSFDIDVTADVINACSVTGAGTINFGDLNPMSPADQNDVPLTGDLAIRCTQGATVNLTAVGGTSRTLASDPSGSIAYTLNLPASLTGDGTTAISLAGITADLSGVAYANQPAGEYSDTVTVNLNF